MIQPFFVGARPRAIHGLNVSASVAAWLCRGDTRPFQMRMAARESLLVVITASLDDGGRKAALAFGVALAALSSGTSVFVFLSLEAAVLGTPSGASDLRPRGFSEPLSAYINHFTDLGGQLEVCSSCFEEYCRDLPKDASGKVALRPGTAIHGLGVVAERASLMPTLTF